MISHNKKPTVFGPLVWRLLFSLSHHADKNLMEFVIRKLCLCLPCVYCQMSLCSYVMHNEINDDTDFYLYILNLYESVKIKLLYQKYKSNCDDYDESACMKFIVNQMNSECSTSIHDINDTLDELTKIDFNDVLIETIRRHLTLK